MRRKQNERIKVCEDKAEDKAECEDKEPVRKVLVSDIFLKLIGGTHAEGFVQLTVC